MMRQRLENDELEKQAAKKDKKIEKLEKKLEKEKVKSFKNKHQLHEWQKGMRTQDDPTGQLPAINWSKEFQKRKEEAEKKKEKAAALNKPIVVQPDTLPALKQGQRKGLPIIDLTESPEMTPPRVKTEPGTSTSTSVSSQGPATSLLKRKFEEEQLQQAQLQEKASPTKTVYPAPATKKVKKEITQSVHPDAIVLSDSSPDRPLDFTKKTLSTNVTATPATTSASSTSTTQTVSKSGTASQADPVVGLTGQPKLRDPPVEFNKYKRPEGRIPILITAVAAFLTNMIAKPFEGDDEQIDTSPAKAPRSSIPKNDGRSKREPRRCWITLPRQLQYI